jgi:DNA-binding NarL/FixJ family response regulator
MNTETVEKPISVLLVDDHPLFRRGVLAVLSADKRIMVVGEASNGKEGVSKARELDPDVVLMDIQMPEMTGLEATVVLQKEMPRCKILMLTISEKDEDLFNAVKFGAKGYLLKEVAPEEIISAVVQVAGGEVRLTTSMATKLLGEFKSRGEKKGEEQDLSRRENEVLQYVTRGYTNREIADTLFISENTVKVHLRNILDKLHMKNRAEAATYAVRMGLV